MLKVSSPRRRHDAVSMVQREVPLLSARDLRRSRATVTTAATTPISPVPLVDKRSLCQLHSTLNHHTIVQHQHGHVAWTVPTMHAVNGCSQLL